MKKNGKLQKYIYINTITEADELEDFYSSKFLKKFLRNVGEENMVFTLTSNIINNIYSLDIIHFCEQLIKKKEFKDKYGWDNYLSAEKINQYCTRYGLTINYPVTLKLVSHLTDHQTIDLCEFVNKNIKTKFNQIFEVIDYHLSKGINQLVIMVNREVKFFSLTENNDTTISPNIEYVSIDEKLDIKYK